MTTEWKTLVDLLEWRAAHQSNRTVFNFLDNGETKCNQLTFVDLDQQAKSIAAQLMARKASGERVLLLYPPGLDFIAALYGCFYAGAIAVPAYPPQLGRYNNHLTAIINTAQPKLFLTTSDFLNQIRRRSEQEALLSQLDSLVTDQNLPTMNMTPSQPEPNSLAFLQYTSGSIAQPKGVMVTHNNVLNNLDSIVSAFNFNPDDPHQSGVSWLPPYHDMGLIGGIFLAIYTGRPLTMMSPLAFIQKPIRWLQAMSDTQATFSVGPNFAYDLCVTHTTPAQRADLDLSCWDIAIVGSDPVRHRTLKRFADTFAPYGFREEAFCPSYGMAETTLMVSYTIPSTLPTTQVVQGDLLQQHQVSSSLDEQDGQLFVGCGRPLAEHQVMIVNPQTRMPSAHNQVGEVWVSGPSVAHGYWGKPEETEQTFQAYLSANGSNPAGPFLRTGDLGFFQEGELFITGRLKDLIIIRGRNYYPQDIEYVAEESHVALRSNSGAAFSVEVDDQEQLVIVFELERNQRKANVDEVAAAVRAALAQIFEIETYAVVLIKMGHLPKTTSGKVQRRRCREQFLRGTLPIIGQSIQKFAETLPDTKDDIIDQPADTAPSALRQRLEKIMYTKLAEVLMIPVDQIEPSTSIQNLGLGSLQATTIKFQLENEFEIEIPPELFFEDITLHQFMTKIINIITQYQASNT